MLHIERMRIQLPAGFEHRASFIAHLVGEALADYRPAEKRTLESLSIGPVEVTPNSTDQEIAYDIVQRITARLGEGG